MSRVSRRCAPAHTCHRNHARASRVEHAPLHLQVAVYPPPSVEEAETKPSAGPRTGGAGTGQSSRCGAGGQGRGSNRSPDRPRPLRVGRRPPTGTRTKEATPANRSSRHVSGRSPEAAGGGPVRRKEPRAAGSPGSWGRSGCRRRCTPRGSSPPRSPGRRPGWRRPSLKSRGETFRAGAAQLTGPHPCPVPEAPRHASLESSLGPSTQGHSCQVRKRKEIQPAGRLCLHH